MESPCTDGFFKFLPGSLQEIRKMYNLHDPEVMSDAIRILEEWVKKQEHFVKKDFDKDYLERTIIRAKGSIEKAKTRLDKLCTARTLMPKYFVNTNVKDLKYLECLEDTFLPQLTSDNYRIYLVRNRGKDFESDFYINHYKRLIYMMEYYNAHDYSNGVSLIYDFRETNMVAMMRRLDVVELQGMIHVGMECYGVRVKSIHMISTSKIIDTLVSIFKQVLSAKLGNRIYVHKDLESLLKHVEKDMFPADYGGKEKPYTEIFNDFLDALSSKEHQDHVKMMNACSTDEAYRSSAKFNEECLGLPGTFRALKVD